MIDKLKDDKCQLKQALKETLDKKNDLYSKSKEYHNMLSIEIEKNKLYQRKINDLEFSQKRSEEILSELTDKDQTILDLTKQIKLLENKLRYRSVDYYSDKHYNELSKNHQTTAEIKQSCERMMGKLYINREVYRIFKRNIACVHVFSELFDKQKYEDILLKLMNFLIDLLNHLDEVPNDKSIQTFVEDVNLLESLNAQKDRIQRLSNQMNLSLSSHAKIKPKLAVHNSKPIHVRANSETIDLSAYELPEQKSDQNQSVQIKNPDSDPPTKLSLVSPTIRLRTKIPSPDQKRPRYLGSSPDSRAMPVLRKTDCWDTAKDFFGKS